MKTPVDAKRFKVRGVNNANAWAEDLLKAGALHLRMARGHGEGNFIVKFDWPRGLRLPPAPRW